MRRISVLLSILLLAALIGCSAGKDAITPSPVIPANQPLAGSPESVPNSHQLWGYYQFNWTGSTFEITPLRKAEDHFNVVSLLQSPDWPLGVFVSNVVQNGSVCDLDITLKHPISGQAQYNGYDVKGIFFGDTDNGFEDILDLNLFSTPSYSNSYGIDSRPGGYPITTSKATLLNADGFTCLWNPIEYTGGDPLFSYTPGKIGTSGKFWATANPYKVFADGIGSGSAAFDGISSGNALLFSVGQSRTRHYQIDFIDPDPANWKFQYAVDASWSDAGPVNQPEPVINGISINDDNLHTNAGSFQITVSAFEHLTSISKLKVIAPGIYPGSYDCPFTDGSPVTIPNLLGLAPQGLNNIWVVVYNTDNNWSFTNKSVNVGVLEPPSWTDQIILSEAVDNLREPVCIFASGDLYVVCVEKGSPNDQFIYWRKNEIPSNVHHINVLGGSGNLDDPDLAMYGSQLLLLFNQGMKVLYGFIDPTSPDIPISASVLPTPKEALVPKTAQTATETRFIWCDFRCVANCLGKVFGETYPLGGETEIWSDPNYGTQWAEIAANSTVFGITWHALFGDSSESEKNLIVYKSGFSDLDPETPLMQGAGNWDYPHIATNDNTTFVAWSMYFQEWNNSLGPQSYTRSLLLPDNENYHALSAEYATGQGLVFYMANDTELGVAYLPGVTDPTITTGIFEKNWYQTGVFRGFNSAVSSSEVAGVYIDTSGALHLQTATF